MRLCYLAFTENGKRLADKLAGKTGGDVALSRQAGGVQRWTKQHFCEADGLIYVGAAGIAVRAIAPLLKSKTTDPAVVVMEESGQFAVPILSGHLGGANALARELAAITGGTAVITTATDVNGRFAVDEWAKKQRCVVVNPPKIVQVSSNILEGREIVVQSDWPIGGTAPELVRAVIADDPEQKFKDVDTPDVVLSIYREGTDKFRTGEKTPLRLVPRIAVLGIGCRRGTGAAQIETCFQDFLETNGIEEAAICAVASIDLKKDEPGLRQFSKKNGLPLHVFSAEELRAAKGAFSSSAFVQEITGVDNVCERSAVCAAAGGELLVKKTKYEGVTMALAIETYRPDWNWK